VRNFLAGLLLGVLGTYWYMTQGDRLRVVAQELWTRASSPPGVSGTPRPER
jgi:hypothetical protein